VSASAKLHKVIVWFVEHDPIEFTQTIGLDNLPPLVPDKTQPVGYTIKELNGQHCSVWIQYTKLDRFLKVHKLLILQSH